MQPRRLSKRSVLGNKLGTAKAPSSSRCGMKETLPALGTGSSAGHGRGEEEEDDEEEIDVVQDEEAPRTSCPESARCPYQGTRVKSSWQSKEQQADFRQSIYVTPEFNVHATECKDMSSVVLSNASRSADSEQELRQECTRSVCLLEQKRKVVSSNIDVPQARKYEDELDMDKVTAAMVLTSLSTSPLVRSPPIRFTDVNESWKDPGYIPSSSSSSGYWSWNTTSDYSNPSTPSPPLTADNSKHFRSTVYPDDAPDDTDNGNMLFEDPVPRKRKNSMKVMFKCLWKKCGKILSTAAGIKKHIRTIHLGRTGDSDDCDGEEDFYYTEIRFNNDAGAEGLCSLPLISPSFASPPSTILFPNAGSCDSIYSKTETKLNGRLSRSAPNTFYLVQSDHAYQVCLPCNTSTEEYIPSVHTVRSSPPRAGVAVRKPRGEGKKCRKVYGMENRDKWCTACRWKKACQRFPD
ncbi:zinc finger protein 704 isoform X2 [Hyla sarda]|uniref:zinc finger protein 704 isoform X2 n=2 Tax=Hyla sarda TaxID=327740 RepID=UPI0024C32F7F|nr:zinc finger protein 704 isoform X2 [Hyla sarda]